jgi:hypothetical protein
MWGLENQKRGVQGLILLLCNIQYVQYHDWNSSGILEQCMRARNRVVIGLSYRHARLHSLVESIHGLLKSLKIPSLIDISAHIGFGRGGGDSV